MGKALIAVAIAVLAAANASGAGAKSTHRIDGAVRDVSCPGACRLPPRPPLYTGDGLTVKVRHARSGRLAALRPRRGRFHVRVAQGRYGVSAQIADRCWRGSHNRVRVRHLEVHVRLTVENACLR